MMIPTLTPVRAARRTALIGLMSLAAACGGESAPRADDALRNDLSLATQAQQNRALVVNPQELSAQPNGQLPNGQLGYAAPAVAAAPPRVIERERVVYRDRPTTTTRRRSSGSGGGYSSSGTSASSEAAAERREAEARRRARAVDRQQGAVMGGIAGAAVGAVTAKGGNRVKNGVIGAVAGSVLGGVIGNNQKRP